MATDSTRALTRPNGMGTSLRRDADLLFNADVYNLYIVVGTLNFCNLMMPLFKRGGANFSDSRKSDGDKKLSSNRSAGIGTENNSQISSVSQSSVQIPEPPRSSKSNEMASRTSHPPPQAESRPLPPAPPPKFVFYCQLAHGSATGKVEGFTNVKELYQKIAEVFKIQSSEVSECP